MWKFVFLSILGLASTFASPTAQLLSSDDGLVSLRVPSDWYVTSQEGVLIAAPQPEDTQDLAANRAPVLALYQDGGGDALWAKMLKTHGLSAFEWRESELLWMGLAATRYEGQNAERQALILKIPLPELAQEVRLLITAQDWQAELAESLVESLFVLPQTGKVPRGWTAFLRAPQAWKAGQFASFVQWTAPEGDPLRGTEIWFQAGFPLDLVGQGEAGFVLRSLGINYLSQVDNDNSFQSVLGGLPALAQPFESFTHTGIAYHAETVSGSGYGTANLIARAPKGTWTPAHQQMVDAILASVRILPPTPDAAALGLTKGYRSPDFEALQSDGSAFNLRDYEGQLVILHFWFVDCPACQSEWLYLNDLYQEYADSGVVMLAMNGIDPPAYIAAFNQAMGYDIPLTYDPDGSVHERYGVWAFPTTFFISPEGVILQVAKGVMSEEAWRNLIQQNLPD